jgi:hypothetical protein
VSVEGSVSFAKGTIDEQLAEITPPVQHREQDDRSPTDGEHERSRATSIDDADVRRRHVAIPQVENAYRPMGLPSAFGR